MLDFSAWDNYPLSGAGNGQYAYAALAHDLMRTTKKQNFVVMEQQGGIGGNTQRERESISSTLSFIIIYLIYLFIYYRLEYVR